MGVHIGRNHLARGNRANGSMGPRWMGLREYATRWKATVDHGAIQSITESQPASASDSIAGRQGENEIQDASNGHGCRDNGSVGQAEGGNG